MTENEQEILSEDQLEEGPAHQGDEAWRQRLATAQTRQEFLVGVRERWADHGIDTLKLDDLADDPDRFVEDVAKATGLTQEAVVEDLKQL